MMTLLQNLIALSVATVAMIYVLHFFRREWRGQLHKGCGSCALHRIRNTW